MPRQLTADERLDWLRLIRSENVGPITFFQLLQRYGSAAKALDALPELARRGGRSKPIALFSAMQAEREIAATTGAGARFVAWGEADYPEPLAAIADAPPLIVVTGRDQILNKPAVAVVGARNASANGVRLTRRIAGELGEKGLIVVSGLARGIDAAAHEGSLETGTIAVTAGGIDVVYPAQNEELHRRITDSGAILTEIAFGIQPQARHFPRRNRIISGLALGVLVVEAAPRSGSLITARFALEQGREVFAVPGSPLDPRARGTNNLIRDGAVLTESADDIVAVLEPRLHKPLAEPGEPGFQTPAPAPPDEENIEKNRALIRDLLGPSPAAVDELIRQSHLTPAVVLTILLELELAGLLERHLGNQVSLRAET